MKLIIVSYRLKATFSKTDQLLIHGFKKKMEVPLVPGDYPLIQSIKNKYPEGLMFFDFSLLFNSPVFHQTGPHSLREIRTLHLKTGWITGYVWWILMDWILHHLGISKFPGPIHFHTFPLCQVFFHQKKTLQYTSFLWHFKKVVLHLPWEQSCQLRNERDQSLARYPAWLPDWLFGDSKKKNILREGSLPVASHKEGSSKV